MTRILVNDISPTPDKMTGISVYTWKILQALIDHGAHDYVLATNRPIKMVPAAILDGVAALVQRTVPANETRALIANSLILPRLMRTYDCTAIFHPQPTAMLARLGSSTIVVHDLYRETHPELYDWKQRAQWRWLIAYGLRRAGALIAVSGATCDATVAAYPTVAHRITVVHEASPINAEDVMRAGRSPIAGHYALVVANITPNKNIALVTQALSRLAAAGRRPRVVLAGRDENGVLPGLLARAGDIDLVHLGPVDDATLHALYAGARVYINTSLVEGFCLPILEAHSFGLPVICSDLPVLREVGGDAALFIDPHDADALAAAMADEEALEALRDRAVANARRFSWRRAALETEAVLDRVRMNSVPPPGSGIMRDLIRPSRGAA